MRFFWLSALYYDLYFLLNHYVQGFRFGVAAGTQCIQSLNAAVALYFPEQWKLICSFWSCSGCTRLVGTANMGNQLSVPWAQHRKRAQKCNIAKALIVLLNKIQYIWICENVIWWHCKMQRFLLLLPICAFCFFFLFGLFQYLCNISGSEKAVI